MEKTTAMVWAEGMMHHCTKCGTLDDIPEGSICMGCFYEWYSNEEHIEAFYKFQDEKFEREEHCGLCMFRETESCPYGYDIPTFR